MKIEFVDLKRQYRSIQKDIDKSIKRVLKSARFIFGDELEKFEKEFSAYCDVRYGIGVASGTDALVLAVKALGIGNDDEVITVPNTFASTADAVLRSGATPVFVDINEATFNIDVSKIEEKITKKTKAIIPVHLCGQPADIDTITRIAKRHSLFVIEDACQAHGARYRGKRVGSFGDIGCFSFYPGKNLGAYGDGGMAVTNKTTLARKLRMLRFYGQEEKYYHQMIGLNSRLDAIQAAVLRVKLRKLDTWNVARRHAAENYRELLGNVEDIVLPYEAPHRTHVYYVFMVRTKVRDKLQRYLAARGIATVIHYPLPLHLQRAYAFLGYRKGDFPIAEKCAREILSLPMFPELTVREIQYIAQVCKKFFST